MGSITGTFGLVKPRGIRLFDLIALVVAFVVALGGVAFADTIEVGDELGVGSSAFTVTGHDGDSFSFTAHLWLKKSSGGGSSTLGSGVSFAATGATQGSCAAGEIAGTAASFTTPSGWASATPGTVHGPVAVTISGTITGVSTCTFRYATGQGGVQGNADLTITFERPVAVNHTPQVSADEVSVTVDEGSAASMSGTWSDADSADTVTLLASVGAIVKLGSNSSGTWSWTYTPDDGPEETQVLTITVDDGTGTANATNSTTFQLTVNNVAPTAYLTRSGPANVFVGTTVVFNASATDPSAADTTAGFWWDFGEDWSATSMISRTYESCDVYTESVQTRDKDGGISDPATAQVSVFEGGWHGAIKPAVRNMVQSGRVVPVQIRVSCDGLPVAGLQPTIQLLTGDFDPDTEPSDDAVLTPTSVSAADTSGVMRSVDGGYIYNLLIPKNAGAGTKYTIRVRPWGATGAVLQALVEVRR